MDELQRPCGVAKKRAIGRYFGVFGLKDLERKKKHSKFANENTIGGATRSGGAPAAIKKNKMKYKL